MPSFPEAHCSLRIINCSLQQCWDCYFTTYCNLLTFSSVLSLVNSREPDYSLKPCQVKNFLLSLICMVGILPGIAQLNVTYVGDLEYDDSLSDIWGYVHPDGTEYAIVGVYNGTSIVSLADPSNPTEVAFIPGQNTIWRDMKVWEDYAYVTSDSTTEGLLVIDMINLPESIDWYYWTPDVLGLGDLETCHNIWIDEFGYAYLAGCNVNNGGMIYIDVDTDPYNPSVAGVGPAVYAHDVYTFNNKMYASEIYAGVFSVYDVTDKTNTIYQGDQETAANFTHNAWLSEDETILYTTDEVANAPVGAYDVSNPADIIELDQFLPFETLGDGVIPHNVHVYQDWLIISYYTDGCIIVDGSNPSNLIEVGNFDTYFPPSTGFNGAWGAYPFLPSGLILISDIGNGLYVLEPNYVNACWLEGQVTDADTDLAINGAMVTFQGDIAFDESDVAGNYATGQATAGTYNVLVEKPGYESATASVELENGVITIQDFELVPLASLTLSGQIVSAEDGSAVEGAVVLISNDQFDYEATSDNNGTVTIPSFFAGDYDILAGGWGWVTHCDESTLDEATITFTIELSQGYMDDFALDLGWTVQNNAGTGAWERDEPNGTTFQNNESNPEEDLEDDCLGNAYITGNDGGQAGNDDVDDGSTTLTSPAFPAINNPTVSFWRWFANYDDTVADDQLIVSVTDGTDEIVLATVDANSVMSEWVQEEFVLADYLASDGEYQIIFYTADNFDNGSIVEAGLDGFAVEYESFPQGIKNTEADAIFSIFPNPSNGEINLTTTSEQIGSTVNIHNAQGALVFQSMINETTTNFDLDLSSGVYLVSFNDAAGVKRIEQLVIR